jgi:hypothetical protein
VSAPDVNTSGYHPLPDLFGASPMSAQSIRRRSRTGGRLWEQAPNALAGRRRQLRGDASGKHRRGADLDITGGCQQG